MDATPTPSGIETALDQLAPRDRAQAALHLALPASEVLDFAVQARSTTWTWRGVSVDASADPVAAATLLAQLGRRDDDHYLDLGAEPSEWVKVVRSGARSFAFGSDLLFGGPSISADPGVPAGAHRAALRAWRAGAQAPLALEVDGSVVLVDGDAESWALRAQEAPAVALAPTDEGDVEAMGAWLASELGAQALGSVVLGARGGGIEVEHHLIATGWSLVVPVLVTGNSEVVGELTHDLLPAHAADVPDGWVARGWSLWHDTVVAEHVSSGVVARLKRS